MRVMPGKPMQKLFISLIAVVLIAVSGFGWLATVLYETTSKKQDDTKNEVLEAYVLLGQNLAGAINHQDAPADILESWPELNNIIVSLIDKRDFPLPDNLKMNFEGGEPLTLESDGEILVNYNLEKTGQVLSIAIPTDLITQSNYTISLILTLVFYAGIALVIVIWLYPLLRRLMLLRSTAIAFGSGKLNARTPESEWSYIRDIEHEFNRMAAKIETLLSDNKLLSRAVSHDLKTPIARLRFGFEMLEETEDREQRTRYLARIGHDISEMESLILRLLEYARLEESAVHLNFQALDLNNMLSRLGDYYEGINDIEVELNLDDTISEVRVDPHYFKMLINNVLGNAQHYAKSRIKISTKAEGRYVKLIVEDDGPGIPEAERKEVLKPFIRGKEKSESHGHGMGLAIVSRIASWHSAELDITSSASLGGAQLCVRLPGY